MQPLGRSLECQLFLLISPSLVCSHHLTFYHPVLSAPHPIPFSFRLFPLLATVWILFKFVFRSFCYSSSNISKILKLFFFLKIILLTEKVAKNRTKKFPYTLHIDTPNRSTLITKCFKRKKIDSMFIRFKM